MRTSDDRYDIRKCTTLQGFPDLMVWTCQVERPNPFCVRLTVDHSEIDDFGHVNNTVYARWMEACAWAHSTAVGLPPAKCVELGRGMALRSLQVDFVRPAFEGQTITILNWITKVDRLRAERRFQVIADTSIQTLALGTAGYVCIDLATGAPTRMPAEFSKGYRATAAEI